MSDDMIENTSWMVRMERMEDGASGYIDYDMRTSSVLLLLSSWWFLPV